jgi:hypothetical protein
MGKRRRDINGNSHIRGIPNQELVTKMVDKMELRWFGCLIRMYSNRKPKQVWETRVEGTKGRGRPRMEWEEHVRKLMKKKGKTLQQAIWMVKERKASWIWFVEPKA